MTRLEQVARDRGVDLDALADALEQLPAPTKGRLSDAEEDALLQLGVDPTERSAVPELAAAARRQQFEEECLTTEQAAELTGRDPSRIRQRLTGPQRSLLGFHRQYGRREWLLPRLQFDLGVAGTPEWARLVRALPPMDDASPVGVVRWLETAQPHLGGHSRAQAVAEPAYTAQVLAEAAGYPLVP